MSGSGVDTFNILGISLHKVCSVDKASFPREVGHLQSRVWVVQLPSEPGQLGNWDLRWLACCWTHGADAVTLMKLLVDRKIEDTCSPSGIQA